MATDFDPDEVANREFGHTLRGYDVREVRSFLSEVANALGAAEREAAQLRRRIGEMDEGELEQHIDETTAEISGVLHAARVAAQSMQDRTAEEAETLTLKAREAATHRLRAAEADAYQLRKAAWETSTQMLDDVRREWAALKKKADKDTLAIIGEAERNAHRKVADAKREAEARTRSSRLEAEKMLVEARARRDEMLDEAQRAVDAAQERVRALERRRDELLGELESIRTETLVAGTEPHPPPSEYASTTVRLLPAEGDTSPRVDEDEWEDPDLRIVPSSGARWADGSDTVRLIPAGTRSPAPELPDVDADELADEISRLRTDEHPAVVEEPVEQEEPAAEPAVTSDVGVTSTGQEQGAEVEVPAPEPAAPEPAEDAPVEVQPEAAAQEEAPHSAASQKAEEPARGDELGTLFDLLRDDEPDQSPPLTPAVEPVEAAISEETAIEDLIALPAPDPVELRERTLLPVMNRALRAVKRALTEVQNGELEALKADPDGFVPEPGPLAALVEPEVLILVREARAAGVESAVVLTGVDDFDRNGIRRLDPGASSLAGDAHADVVAAIAEAREGGLDVRDLTAAVAKVYRVWRADEAERRIRHLAGEAYHRGLAEALAAMGVEEITVTVVGSGCQVCNGAAGDHRTAEVIEGEDGVPPFHEECRCTLVPA